MATAGRALPTGSRSYNSSSMATARTNFAATTQVARNLCTLAARMRSRVAVRATLSDRELEIKLAIAQSTDRLDLSDCQLSELPSGLCDLTNLVELSLAGNQLQQLPADIAQLSNLRRLVLAGNLLTQLPLELLQLTTLEGLWVHGNLLQHVPEQLGQLANLKHLSLAGNCLSHVPDSLTQLVHLEDLNLSGNQVTHIPDGIGALTALRKLSLHGNQLQQVPQDGWQHLQLLDEICLQGNRLTAVPDSLAQLGALTELSLADNQLQSLPEDLSGWTALRKAHLYGNQFKELPLGPRGLPCLLLPDQHGAATPTSSNTNSVSSSSSKVGGNGAAAAAGPGLASLWLEGNPLSAECVSQLLQIMKAAAADTAGPSTAGSSRKLPRVGLDDKQLSGSELLAEWQLLQQRGCTSVRRGIVKGEGPGYFKLQLGRHAANSGSSSTAADDDGDRVLVVAFGSAPGLPNWGGVLQKVTAAADGPEHLCFDVLYVVDPHRSWYCGGDAALMNQRYTSRLRQYTQQYKHVVMVGDSMGATAALLFSPLATSVLSFCPQVDLTTSSIRPGQPVAWQSALQDTLQSAVAASTASIKVFTGTWQHDVDQANLLTAHKNVQIKVHSVDSHRLALALAGRGKLAPLLGECILNEVGINSGNVRLANLL